MSAAVEHSCAGRSLQAPLRDRPLMHTGDMAKVKNGMHEFSIVDMTGLHPSPAYPMQFDRCR
jgi:hypothetical protein